VPHLIDSPSRVEAAGRKPMLIDEFVGRVNTGQERVSVARMQSPEGWVEPGGAHDVAVCLPAFSPDTVHRDEA
jgi:hypothetical protein